MNAEAKPGIAPAFLALLVGALIMGFSPVFVREAQVGAFASAFWRVFFAMPVLLAWYFWEARRINRPSSGGISTSAMLAGVFFAGDLVFWHLAILNTTMANATFMACLAPVWVVLLSPKLISERSSKSAILGLLLCITGMGVLIHSSFRFNPERLIGDFYGIITSLFLGLYFIAIRAGRRKEPSSRLFTTSTAATTLILFAIALLSGDRLQPETGAGWASLVSLGVLTHAVGQGLVAIAVGALSAMFSSLVIFLEAVAAAFFGWLIFQEDLNTSQLVGGAIILAGVWHARPRSGGIS